MKKTYLKYTLWALVILCMIIIFYFSAQPAPKSNSLSGNTIRKVAEMILPNFQDMKTLQQENFISNLQHTVRKTAHMLIYTLLGLLCMTELLQHSIRMKRRFLIVMVICTAYAITDELHQLFVDGRSAQISDVFIDLCGAFIGIMICLLIHRIWIRQNKLNLNRK